MGRPTKKKRKTIGRLRPEDAYNADGLMRFFGIGEKTLKRARSDGVRPVQVGTQHVYRGRELIEWMFGEGKFSSGTAGQVEGGSAAGGG